MSRDIALKPVVSDRLNAATGGIGVIRAAAGYGKTTQAALWARADGRPVGWFELDTHLNDAYLLINLLADGLRRTAGIDLGPTTQRRLTDRVYSSSVCHELGDAVRSGHDAFVLVLDGAHVLTNPAAIDLVDAVVRNIPDRATVVATSRGRPPMHMARLVVDGAVTELTERDLALDLNEARAVLAERGVIATDEQLSQLMERTEGWPVGVRLVAGSKRTVGDSASAHDAVPFSTAAVDDYLREEWLHDLAPDEYAFIVNTSGCQELTAPLCDAVLGRDDSAQLLERLGSTRRVLLPVDHHAGCFRVHPLLREVLDGEFETSSPSVRRAVDERASVWFEQAGDIDRAVAHAHRAGDLARAERLVDAYALSQHMQGQIETVQRWLDSFPIDYSFTSVPLCVMAAVSAMAQGDGPAARTWLSFGERAVRANGGDDTQVAFHHLAVYRAMLDLGPIAETLSGAELAYRALPPGTWHASACLILGAARFALGDERAEAMLAEGATEAKLAKAHSIEALCRAHLSIVLAASGERSRSAREARTARGIVDDFHLEDLPTMALVIAVSSHVEALDGALERARAESLLARRHLADLADAGPWANIQSRVALAQMALIVGDRVAAQTFVDEAHVYVRRQPDALVPKAQLVDIEHRIRMARRTIAHGPSALTNAELKVLHLLPTNLTLAGIAGRLFVSRTTVNSHTRSIYRKLGTSTRRNTVDVARAAGLLPDEPTL